MKTTITLNESTWDKLKELKCLGDSFDDVINRLLKNYRNNIIKT